METDYKKKYEEALNKARELHGTVAAGRDFLAEIFPELRESEDERLCNLIAKCIALGRKQGLVNDDDNIACLDLLMRKGTSWSRGDENMLKLIISELEQEGKDVNAPELYKIEIDWLKSLRPPQYCENCKLKRSVENWKPSEEQMEALQCAITFMEIRKASDYDISPLKELYEQLKKL